MSIHGKLSVTDSLSRPASTARYATAAIATALVLASCTPSTTEGTAEPTESVTTPAETSDGGGATATIDAATPTDEETTDDAIPTESEEATDTEQATVTSAPVMFALYPLGDLGGSEAGEFPIAPETVQEAITASAPDGGLTDVSCPDSVGVEPDKQGVECSFTNPDGKTTRAYAYAVSGYDREPHLLLTFEAPLDGEAVQMVARDDVFVYQMGSGSMFGVGQPADPEQVAGLLQSTSEGYHLSWDSATCPEGVRSDDPDASRVTCTISIGDLDLEVPVYAGHIASTGDNGLIMLYDTSALNP